MRAGGKIPGYGIESPIVAENEDTKPLVARGSESPIVAENEDTKAPGGQGQ